MENNIKSACGNEQVPGDTLCEAKADLTLTAHMKNQTHSAFVSYSDSEMTRSVAIT